MAISLVGTAQTSGTSSGTVALPSGLLEGDVTVVGTGADLGGTPATPTGYTSIDTIDSSVDFQWAYKVQGATPDTQASGLTSAPRTSHISFALRGVDTTNVLDVSAQQALDFSGTSDEPNPPAVTTVTDGAWVIYFCAFDDDLVSLTQASGYTEIIEDQFGSAGNGGTTTVAYKVQTTAGVEDPGLLSSPTTDAWAVSTVAFRPLLESGFVPRAIWM